MRLVARVWGGSSPPVLLVHATGFCKEVWEPVVDELRAAGVGRECRAVDQRGHGDSGVSAPPFDWWDLGRDLLEMVGDEPVPLAIGHSSGAAALVMAEVVTPGTFRSLVLVEPIIFPPPFQRFEDNPMSETALRRRAEFASPDAAFDNFLGKGPFAQWDERALAAYVRGGLREEHGTWHLKCRPEVEAEFYRAATTHGAWERMGEVRCPVLVVGGEHSDSHPAEFLAAQTGRFPNAAQVVLPGASHFAPMEQPGAVADLAAEVLRRIGE